MHNLHMLPYGTPKSSILIGFSLINHPFWGTIIFGNTHIYIYICISIGSQQTSGVRNLVNFPSDVKRLMVRSKSGGHQSVGSFSHYLRRVLAPSKRWLGMEFQPSTVVPWNFWWMDVILL